MLPSVPEYFLPVRLPDNFDKTVNHRHYNTSLLHHTASYTHSGHSKHPYKHSGIHSHLHVQNHIVSEMHSPV